MDDHAGAAVKQGTTYGRTVHENGEVFKALSGPKRVQISDLLADGEKCVCVPELDKSYAARIPGDEQTCQAAVAIQRMADTLSMKVCAKGVNTQDQFEFFEEIGFFKRKIR